MRFRALAYVMLVLPVFGVDAIAIRSDIPDSAYLVDRSAFPALADLPSEGHAELISERWLVTAAHAVRHMQDAASDMYVILDGHRRAVEEIVFYPDYEASAARWDQLFDTMKKRETLEWLQAYHLEMSSMHDIALLKLRDPVYDVRPVSLYREANELGSQVVLYGRGATGNGLEGAAANSPHRGALRRAENRISSVRGQWDRYVFDCGPMAEPTEGAMGGGDSGGPLLIRSGSGWALAGINHGMDGSLQDVKQTKSGDLKSPVCGQTFAASRISFYASWIERTTSLKN